MLKKIILSLALVLAPVSAQAQTSISVTSSMCPTLVEMAGTIMHLRQMGVDRSELDDTNPVTSPAYSIVKVLIDSAYKFPLMPTKEGQNMVIYEYRGIVASACYKNTSR